MTDTNREDARRPTRHQLEIPMNTDITKDLVLAYHLGRVRDPDLRKAIEDAREWDPFVRRWFSLLTDMTDGEPTAVPFDNRKPYAFRKTHDLMPSKRMAALAGDPEPPKVTPFPTELPAHEFELEKGKMRLTYAAVDLPFGVARVTVRVDGEETAHPLVWFPKYGEREKAYRQAVVALADFNIPRDKPSEVDVYVVFAVEETMAEFPLAEVEQLLASSNGNSGQYLAVQALANHLKARG